MPVPYMNRAANDPIGKPDSKVNLFSVSCQSIINRRVDRNLG